MFLGLNLSEVDWFASFLNAVTKSTDVLFKIGFLMPEMHLCSLPGMHYRKNKSMENAANCRTAGDFKKKTVEMEKLIFEESGD